MLHYLEKEYKECVARGEEPPFDFEDLLRRYGSSPPNSEVSAPPSSSAHSNAKTVENLCVVVRIFKFHVYV